MDGSFYREIAEQEAFEKTCEEGEIHHVATLESELAQVKRERDCYLSALTEYHCPGSMYGLAGNRSWCVGLLCCNHETQASWKKMAARCWVLQKWEWYLEAARAATEGK